MRHIDGLFKIIILIFLASFYDILEFMIIVFFISEIINISPTISNRLGSLTTISAGLICSYVLGFKTGKHHKYSLILLGILLCITLIIEYLFQSNDIALGKSLLAHLLICLYLIFISFTDCIEKYLTDINFLSPFKIIMFEGIFGFIFSIFYSINKDPFKEIKNKYEQLDSGYFVLLIILLILYFILSAGINSYKIYFNFIYSPMARSLVNYIMNPVLNIIIFIL